MLQQAVDDIAVVLLVPEAAEIAVWILELVKHRLPGAAARVRRAGLQSPPEAAQPVDRDRAQPVAESPGLATMLEDRQLPDQHGEHFLGEIIQVGLPYPLAAQPTVDQRRIEIHQPLPGAGVGRVTEPLQKTSRGFWCHAVSVRYQLLNKIGGPAERERMGTIINKQSEARKR